MEPVMMMPQAYCSYSQNYHYSSPMMMQQQQQQQMLLQKQSPESMDVHQQQPKRQNKMSLDFILNPTPEIRNINNRSNVQGYASDNSQSQHQSQNQSNSVSQSQSSSSASNPLTQSQPNHQPLEILNPNASIFNEQEMRRKRSTGRKGHKKHFWTQEEDEKLINLVKSYGTKKWAEISRDGFEGQRSGAQLRARYIYCITKQGRSSRPFTSEEDLFILNQYAQYGGIWTKIAIQLQDRNDQDVKNRYLKLRRHSMATSAGGSSNVKRTASDNSNNL